MGKIFRYILLILLVHPYSSCAQKENINKDLSELIYNTHLYFSETPIIKEDIHSFLISKNGANY